MMLGLVPWLLSGIQRGLMSILRFLQVGSGLGGSRACCGLRGYAIFQIGGCDGILVGY